MARPNDAGSHNQPLPNLLSACPFCGDKAQLHHGHGDITYVLCEGCGAVTSFRPNLKGAHTIVAWNKRAAPKTTAKLVIPPPWPDQVEDLEGRN